MPSLRAWIQQADVDSWAVLSASFQAPPGWGQNPEPHPGDFRFRSPDGLLVTPLMLRDAAGQEWVHLGLSREDRDPTLEDARLAVFFFAKPRSSVWLPLDDRALHDPAGRKHRVSVWVLSDGRGMPFVDGEVDVGWLRHVLRPQQRATDAFGRPVSFGLPPSGQGFAAPAQMAPARVMAVQSSGLRSTVDVVNFPQATITPEMAAQAAREEQARQIAHAQALQAEQEAQAAVRLRALQEQALAAQAAAQSAAQVAEQAQAAAVQEQARLANERAVRSQPPAAAFPGASPEVRAWVPGQGALPTSQPEPAQTTSAPLAEESQIDAMLRELLTVSTP